MRTVKGPPEAADQHLGWLTAAGALAAAGLVRAARGYRPFPSIDDFAYVPMALAKLDPHLFSRDTLLRETPLHVPLLPSLLAVLEATTGLAPGFWLITIVLSLLTALAMYRWMRALGVAGALLPMALIVVCAGRVQGLGRAEFDGIFGDAFHFQWAALCALLWAYDGVLRARWVRALALLVLSVALHPAVGAHGVVAMTCGVAFARASRTRGCSWLIPITVAACALPAASSALFMRGGGTESITEFSEAAQAFLFRLPHEYEIDRWKLMLVLLLVAAGISGAARLAGRTVAMPIAAMLGLLVGHLLLLTAACVLYEARSMQHWSAWTTLPFQLSLSRTSSISMALAAVLGATAIEAGFLGAHPRRARGFGGLASGTVLAAAVVCLAAVQVKWSWPVGLSCGVAAVSAVAIRERVGYRALGVAWVGLLIGGLVLFAGSGPLAARVGSDQEQLLRWARSKTPVDGLFIIPPGFQEFRIHAVRSVYVDFKTVTPADTQLLRLWRRRLEQVAAPDALAREARGWPGIAEWDRTYAGRNTPVRIESLLRETGADYFVWDRQGLLVPPFVHRERLPNPSLAIAFENARYTVYRLVR